MCHTNGAGYSRIFEKVFKLGKTSEYWEDFDAKGGINNLQMQIKNNAFLSTEVDMRRL